MIGVGDIAPNFTLTDVMGETYTLSQITENETVVLVFYRGDWCPYCQIQMHQLGKRLGEFEDKKARLLAISPQRHEKNEEFARKRGVTFPILWDEGQKVINEWGLAHELDQHQEHIPHPTTYVITKGNEVIWRKLGDHIGDRPEPEDILAVIPV